MCCITWCIAPHPSGCRVSCSSCGAGTWNTTFGTTAGDMRALVAAEGFSFTQHGMMSMWQSCAALQSSRGRGRWVHAAMPMGAAAVGSRSDIDHNTRVAWWARSCGSCQGVRGTSYYMDASLQSKAQAT
ncbi:hypothetical protein HaLaN_04798 [Haematococcus lacustris]|uniref:Uncharacterized protein n=1 Tax=Haematococcus lacustris TaxID=44745 RepID=A0A699YJF3_HAELA|nr:hypothetical protein HaLaN_04798 [Haematococcus lacustris]